MFEVLKLVEKAVEVGAQAPLEVGAVAPDFRLHDQEGRTVRLYDLRGRPVVLIFYPADHTPVCSDQLRAFDALRDRIEVAGGALYGVNPGGADSHRAFRAALGLGFDLLVDAGARAARRWRATWPLARRVRRTVYAVTPGGRIAFAERGTPAPEAVVRALGLWDPPARPADEGVPVDQLLQVGEPGSGGRPASG